MLIEETILTDNPTQTELITFNFAETRRRSIKLWRELPQEHYFRKLDEQGMHGLEMVRQVLEADYLFHFIIENTSDISKFQLWNNRPYKNLQNELDFAAPFRESFINTVQNFSVQELTVIEIIRSGNKQRRKLVDYLLKMAYQEAVQAGQFLSYLRALGVDSPST
jgi:hypothetical protein